MANEARQAMHSSRMPNSLFMVGSFWSGRGARRAKVGRVRKLNEFPCGSVGSFYIDGRITRLSRTLCSGTLASIMSRIARPPSDA